MNRDVCDLYDELVKVDRQASENIHKNNKKRVVRALELYYLGSGKTQQNEASRKEKALMIFFILYLITKTGKFFMTE